MDTVLEKVSPQVNFETDPSRYKHWKLSFDGPIATLAMDVSESGGLASNYSLKLNSYDLAVDIELADAIERLRFEHPETKAVIVSSAKDRIFCAGANIFMLGTSTHPFKVNFCKFTNETRLGMEDASLNSGLKFLGAVNGVCAGGGYELALACDEIVLVDDGNSSVSLPEVPLLGVLPGTGGLTRVVDKRHVRRDLADIFSTLAEGVRGKRSVEWGLVDACVPKGQFQQAIADRARALAGRSDRPGQGPGIRLTPLDPKVSPDSIEYKHVTVQLDAAKRTARVMLRGPSGPQPHPSEEWVAAGADSWALRFFRELDDALLRLRLNHLEIGTLVFTSTGDPAAVLSVDRSLVAHDTHWAVREVIGKMRRTLKRLDVMSKSLLTRIEPGSCFAGSLFEIALASDRSYMLDGGKPPATIALSPMNAGPLPMGNGLTRLQTRFLGKPSHVDDLLLQRGQPFDAKKALAEGLVTAAPDELDWEDEVRLAAEERASLSPDALTGLEANLRFAGPETMETKIFGRLSAWQNWIFQRPNAVGERGALKLYGQPLRPEFDWKRT